MKDAPPAVVLVTGAAHGLGRAVAAQGHRRSPAARVVNLPSGAGSHGDPAFGLTAPGGTTASISKAALNALTATPATELADTGVLLNAICTGAEDMGARPVEESAPDVVWAATLPSGGLFRDGRPLAW
jgi:NAD(P)-dependent dehydrogenase (short-subunit alcohol dehydrogenase family)